MGRIATADELITEIINGKRSSSCIVFVHGKFDLLHPGHVRLLEQARSLGDVLVVAVHREARDHSETAAAVADGHDRESKSVRSVTPSAERAEIVAALAAVDLVTEIDPSGIAEFVERLRPDVLVKGATSSKNIPTDDEVRAEEIVTGAGGRVTIIPLEPGYSTASLMDRIRQAGA